MSESSDNAGCVNRNVQDVVKTKRHEPLKKLPNRQGRGVNPRYSKTNNQKKKDKQAEDNMDIPIHVPKEKEDQFVKENHVFYVVLSEKLEMSNKQITFCCGCRGKIKSHEKRFPNNMVFHYLA